MRSLPGEAWPAGSGIAQRFSRAVARRTSVNANEQQARSKAAAIGETDIDTTDIGKTQRRFKHRITGAGHGWSNRQIDGPLHREQPR